MTTFGDALYQYGGQPVGPLGVGNVYYVVDSGESYYDAYIRDRQGTYKNDDSAIVHTTIQSALDVTVECRNDYVIVQPKDGDYDITTALSMSKKAVHLICPAGFGYTRGANNAARIHQTGAYPIIELEDAAIEVAGFYLKNYYSKGGIILNNNVTYGMNVHHNYWAMSLTTSTNEPMFGPLIANTTGAAGAWGTFSQNFIQSQAGASATIAAICRTNSQATGTRFCENDIGIGDTDNTATVGILCGSVKGMVNDNNFFAYQTASGAGVFTHCISIHASGVAYGNRGNVVTHELVVGGTDNLSFIQNYGSTSGGTQLEQV